MEWRDLWEKWWPERKSEREHIPLTDKQRRLTGYLVAFVIGAAVLLQFTSNKIPSPALSPGGMEPASHSAVEQVAGLAPSVKLKFEEELVDVGDEPFNEEEDIFFFREYSPCSLNKDYNYYEFKKLCYTNLEIVKTNGIKSIFQYQNENLAFY